MSNDLKPNGPKNNHKKKGVAKAWQLQRRKEAEERQAAYAKVPFEQKLAKAGAKERAKLLAKQK